MFNIVLFGPPGSGKGTHSASIAKKYNLTHISTGDLLRNEIANGSEIGNIAKNLIDKGEFVPDEVVIKMIENKVDALSYCNGFILDGFPRTKNQALILDDLFAKRAMKINIVIALEVEEQELIERILIRGKQFGRVDDQDASVIQKRIRVYHEKTEPVKDFYLTQGKVAEINSTGCTIEEVFENIQKVINKIF